MKLVLTMYPHRKMSKHKGDSAILYESGKRVTDIDKIDEAFDDYVEESEGESVEVSPLIRSGIKDVPKTSDHAFPSELNNDKRIMSQTAVDVSMFTPSARDIMELARDHSNKDVQEQLMGMLFSHAVWLSQICDGLEDYKEEDLRHG